MSTTFPTGFSTLASVTGTTKVLADDGSNNGVATVNQIMAVGDPRVPTSGNTVGNVPAFTSTGGQLGASPISVSGSNVGIGTTTPNAKLDVNGTISSTATQINKTDATIGFELVRSGVKTLSFADISNLAALMSADGFSFYTGNTNSLGQNTNGTEKVRITSAGNVGIGTTSPTVGYKLDVIGDVRCNALTQYSDETRKDKVSDLSAVALPFLKALVTAGADMAFTWKSKDAETKTVTRDVPVTRTVEKTRVEVQNVNGTWREVTVTDTVTEPVTEEQTYIALDGSTKTHRVPVMQTVTETETITPAMESGSRVHWGLSAQKTKAAADALGVSFGGYKDSAIKDPSRPSVKGLDYIELIPALVVALVQVTNDFEAYKAAHP